MGKTGQREDPPARSQNASQDVVRKNVGRVRALSQLSTHLPSPPSSWTSLSEPHLGLMLVTVRVALLTAPPSGVWSESPPNLGCSSWKPWLFMLLVGLHLLLKCASWFDLTLQPGPLSLSMSEGQMPGISCLASPLDTLPPASTTNGGSFAVLIEMQIQIIKSTFKNRNVFARRRKHHMHTHTEGSWNACLQNKAASSRLWIIPSPESGAIFYDGVTGSLNQAATSLLRECSLADELNGHFHLSLISLAGWATALLIGRDLDWCSISVFSLRCARRGSWSAAGALDRVSESDHTAALSGVSSSVFFFFSPLPKEWCDYFMPNHSRIIHTVRQPLCLPIIQQFGAHFIFQSGVI